MDTKKTMNMKKILRSIYITIIVVGILITFSSFQCVRFHTTEIDFAINNDINDSVYVKIKYVANGKTDGYKRYALACHHPSRIDDYVKIYHEEYAPEDNIGDISWDDAMTMLKENIDTVIITRKSDAKTILYHHGANATEKERYFFSQEAWRDYPEYATHVTDKLLSNTYRFFITEELFK